MVGSSIPAQRTAPEEAENWDAVVIGSGLGGLVTAGYLATNGKKTLVLEQYDTVGGCSVAFRRQRKYEFDVGIHYIGDCGEGGAVPTVLRGLGLDGKIEWLPLDQDGFSVLHMPDGLTFSVPAGWDRYVDRLCETFPEEKKNIRMFFRILGKVAAAVDPFEAPIGLMDFVKWPKRGFHATFWTMQPLAALFTFCRLSLACRAIICGEVGVYAAPPSRTTVGLHAAMMDHYLRTGAWYPKGGGQMLPAHLTDVIQSHGGQVRTRARVDSVLIENGKAVGVRLVDGEEFRAPIVVANSDVKRTYLELVGTEHISKVRKWRSEKIQMTLPLFCVYVGLDVDLRDRMPNANIWSHPSNDHENLFKNAYTADVEDSLWSNPPIYITTATTKDPDNPMVAPQGHSVLELMTVVPRDYQWWGANEGPGAGEKYRRKDAYLARKQQITDGLIAKAEELIPGIKDHITYVEAASPLTQERYTLSSDGSCYAAEFNSFQFGFMRPQPATEIPGLYLTGAGTRYCHGVMATMVGGVGTAGVILGKDLLGDIRRGKVFGDPTKLTAGGPGWDPLLASQKLSKRDHERRAAGLAADVEEEPVSA